MKRKTKEKIRKLIIHIVLLSLGISFVLPFFWMLATSLKTPYDLIKMPPVLWPEKPQWGNYKAALTAIPFLRYTGNSLFILVFSVFGAVCSATMVAYAFAKLRWPGRDIWFTVMLATMMLPVQVTLIPLFIMYSKFGWLNTYKPLILPYFFGGGAFYIFLLRQFFKGIPDELLECSKIDGANHLRVFIQIILPLSKPAIITVALFNFMLVWNDFFGPLIFLTDPDKATLALGLRAFQQRYTGQWNLMMAVAIVAMMPTVIIFFIAQKYFVEGITFSGIKG